MCTIPLLRKVCRESYNQPLEVYEKLKRLGMDLVTVTDHDSIDAVEELRSRARFLPQRRGHLHAAQRQPAPRGRLRHHRARPHRTAAPARRFRVPAGMAGGSGPVLQRQSRFLQPDRTPLHRRLPPLRNRLPRPGNAQRPHAGQRQRQCRLDGRSRRPRRSGRQRRPRHGERGVRVDRGARRAQSAGVSCRACAAAWDVCAAKLAAIESSRATSSPSAGKWYGKTPRPCPSRRSAWMVPLILLHNSIREAVFARWWMARYMQSCSHEERGRRGSRR